MKQVQKLLAAVLAVLLFVTVVPLSALAATESNSSRKEVLVNITVALEGAFQKGNDGTLMVEVPLVVSDSNGDGAITVKEALEQVHLKYCPKGFSVKKEKDGPVISKLWNHKVVNSGFYVNNHKGLSLQESLNFYDSLYVFSEKSAVDTYTYFDKNDDQAASFREYPVQLYREAYNSKGKVIALPLENAELYQVKEDGSLKDLHVKTDKEGKATLIFREAGDVILTAKPPMKDVVSPVLKVKVANGILSMVLGQQK